MYLKRAKNAETLSTPAFFHHLHAFLASDVTTPVEGAMAFGFTSHHPCFEPSSTTNIPATLLMLPLSLTFPPSGA